MKTVCRRCASSLLCLTKWRDSGFVECARCGLLFYGGSSIEEEYIPGSCPRASKNLDTQALCDTCMESSFGRAVPELVW